MSRRRTRVIICADCGSDAPNQGRALCAVCYSRHHHAGTLDAYQLHMLQAAFPDVWDEVQALYNAQGGRLEADQ